MSSSTTPGRSWTHCTQSRCPGPWPSTIPYGLGTPNHPTIRFKWAEFSGLPGSLPLQPSEWLASLADPTRPQGPADGDFYARAFDGSVALPVVGYDYDGNWVIPSVELSSTRTFASFAAQECLRRRADPSTDRNSQPGERLAAWSSLRLWLAVPVSCTTSATAGRFTVSTTVDMTAHRGPTEPTAGRL